jgi:ketosteroid isomerase-like protein
MSTRDLAERFVASLEARDWDGWVATMQPDVVYEVPQTRERIRGRDRYLQFNREFPGDWHLSPAVTVADDDHAVVVFRWRVADADGQEEQEEQEAIVVFGFRDGLIATVTDFWPDPYEPPPGREHLTERW